HRDRPGPAGRLEDDLAVQDHHHPHRPAGRLRRPDRPAERPARPPGHDRPGDDRYPEAVRPGVHREVRPPGRPALRQEEGADRSPRRLWGVGERGPVRPRPPSSRRLGPGPPPAARPTGAARRPWPPSSASTPPPAASTRPPRRATT